MLKIDRLILRLPPEFSGREKALGRALADALGQTPAFSRAQTIAGVSAAVPSVRASQSNAAVARHIAAHVHTQISAELGGRAP
jgi:hypothetical protein